MAAVLVGFFSSNFVTAAQAITGTIPQPIIGTAQGFYAGKSYPTLVGVFSTAWSLQPGEVMKSSGILVYQVEIAGAPCGPTVSTSKFVDGSSKRLNDSTNKSDANFTFTFTVPEDAANKAICAIFQLMTSSGVYESAATYATVSQNPDATESATPTASATAQAAAVPTGSKPTFPSSPQEGVKQKVKVRKWKLNGADFVSRSVTVYSCEKSDCADKTEANSVTFKGLKANEEKTITMSSAIGDSGNYLVAYDRLVYGDNDSVENATNIRKISEASATIESEEETTETEAEPTEDVSASESASALAEVEIEETQDAVVAEAEAGESANNLTTLLIGLAAAIVVLLLVVIWQLRKKK